MTGIYKITNPKGKIYIGQSVNALERLSHYKRFDCKEQPKIYNSLIKYGVENHTFEIINFCNVDELNYFERYYQELYDVVKNGLNCKLTKTNDRSGYYSEEAKIKMSLSQTGKKQSQETIKKRSISQTGKKQSQETINKKRISREGYLHSNETKLKISLSQKGKKISEETKLKMSIFRNGKKLSVLSKKKLAEKKSKILLNTETGIYYESIKDASNLLGINYSTLASKLSSNCKRSSNNTNLIFV